MAWQEAAIPKYKAPKANFSLGRTITEYQRQVRAASLGTEVRAWGDPFIRLDLSLGSQSPLILNQNPPHM